MKKIISVFLISIFTVFLAAGCAADPASDATSDMGTDAELEIWMCYDRNVPGSYYVFLWDTLAEEYGFTVDVKTYSRQEIEDKLQMAMVCNELPDIFMVPGGSYPESLFASGACLSVGDYLQQADFKEEYTLAYTDGNQYLIPCLPESYAVAYYDESLMEQMGLSVPETWEELLELVRKVQAYNEENGTDYAAIEMGMKDNWMGALLYCMVAQRLDPELYGSLVDDPEESAQQLMGEAAEYLQELMDLGAFPEDCVEIGEAEAVKNFINHDAVLMVHQTSLVYHLIQNMGADGFSLESFPACNNDYGEECTSWLMEMNHTYTPGLAVSVRCAYKEEAVNLCLEFAAQVNKVNVEEYNYLNITNTDYDAESFFLENVERIHTLVDRETNVCGFLYTALPQETGDIWGNLLKRFYAGELDAEQLSEAESEQLSR